MADFLIRDKGCGGRESGDERVLGVARGSGGVEALPECTGRKPNRANRIDDAVEQAVICSATDFPAYGLARTWPAPGPHLERITKAGGFGLGQRCAMGLAETRSGKL